MLLGNEHGASPIFSILYREIPWLGSLKYGFVTESHELVGLEGNHRVGSTVTIAKFDLEYTGSPIFNDGTDLTAH